MEIYSMENISGSCWLPSVAGIYPKGKYRNAEFSMSSCTMDFQVCIYVNGFSSLYLCLHTCSWITIHINMACISNRVAEAALGCCMQPQTMVGQWCFQLQQEAAVVYIMYSQAYNFLLHH